VRGNFGKSQPKLPVEVFAAWNILWINALGRSPKNWPVLKVKLLHTPEQPLNQSTPA
jgi:hypothetical protein